MSIPVAQWWSGNNITWPKVHIDPTNICRNRKPSFIDRIHWNGIFTYSMTQCKHSGGSMVSMFSEISHCTWNNLLDTAPLEMGHPVVGQQEASYHYKWTGQHKYCFIDDKLASA